MEQQDLYAEHYAVIEKANARYVCLEMLGKGGFGYVVKAFDLDSLQHVALKVHLHLFMHS